VQLVDVVYQRKYDLMSDLHVYSWPILLGRLLGKPAPAWFLNLPQIVIVAFSLAPFVLRDRARRLRVAIITTLLCVLTTYLSLYCVQEYYYTLTIPVLLVLLWLWRQETSPRLRRMLMVAFLFSLAIFLPTPYFLAATTKNLKTIVMLCNLHRVVPVLVDFACLTFYGAATVWGAIREKRPNWITCDAIRPIKETVWVGGTVGFLMAAVLAAALFTLPLRLMLPPERWTAEQWKEHCEDLLSRPGVCPPVADKLRDLLKSVDLAIAASRDPKTTGEK
jgi:hypothetical protein